MLNTIFSYEDLVGLSTPNKKYMSNHLFDLRVNEVIHTFAQTLSSNGLHKEHPLTIESVG